MPQGVFHLSLLVFFLYFFLLFYFMDFVGLKMRLSLPPSLLGVGSLKGFFYFYFDGFGLSPFGEVFSSHNDVLLLFGWRVNGPDEIHAPLIKWLESHLRLQRHLIPWGRFPHPLALITLASIPPHILVKSGPVITSM